MKIATATYPIDWHDNWASYEAKISQWVADAARSGADLLVFPEYGAMELASLAGADAAGDVEQSMRAVYADGRVLNMTHWNEQSSRASNVTVSAMQEKA